MEYGACYYPEHWPEDRWPTDAKLMREAGLTVVRIGEFAWSKFERRPGEYDFGWLDRSIAVLAAEGIRVVLGTPTATPPKWLMDRHSDIYMRTKEGHVRGFGNRRHYCFNNETYQGYAKQIVKRMAERYGSHPSVIAWQIDNEFGCNETTRCYCGNCVKGFQSWLRRKYGDIETLNERWGTVFWSQMYNDWTEIVLPALAPFFLHNPGLELDYRRFASDSVCAFQKLQIDVLRALAPGQRITHNLMGAFNEVDGSKLSTNLDFVSWDNYPNLHFEEQTDPRWPALQHDLTRGLKETPFWVMEHQSGPPGGNILFQTPKPGELRRWVFQSVARGADAIVFFRWRTALFGAEQFWHGILPHDGIPQRRYEEVRQTGEDLRRIWPLVLGAGAGAEAALIRSFDNEWATEIQPMRLDYRYIDHLRRYYRAFYDMRIPVDIIGEKGDWSRYKLLVLPHFMLAEPDTVERLYTFVRGGGTVLLDYRAGSKREDNQMADTTLPGVYRELLGVRITDYGTLRPTETIGLRLPGSEGDFKGKIWYDVLEPESAEPLAWYAGDYFADSPAVTRNAYGSGKAWYVATDPDEAFMDVLLNRICRETGVEPIRGIAAPAGVEVARRRTADGDVLFVINHSDSKETIRLHQRMKERLCGSTLQGEVLLKPNDVLVLAVN